MTLASLLLVVTLPVSTLTSFAEEYRCGSGSNPQTVECYRQEVKEFLRSWVVAWGNGDPEAYIEHYVPFRSPRNQMSREQWEKDRYNKLSNAGDISVTLELDSLGVGANGNLDVIFIQNYQSASYEDTVRKQLFLHRADDGLKIQREVTLDQ